MTNSLNPRRFVAASATLVFGLVLLVGGATAAGAQDNGDYTVKPAAIVSPAAVEPAAIVSPAAAAPAAAAPAAASPVAVSPAAVSPAATASDPAPAANVRWLAVTGSDLPGLAAIGAILLAAGAGLLVMRRRAATSV